MGLHALFVGAVIALASIKLAKSAEKKEVEVSFIGPGKGKGAPPPPPAPAAKKSTPTPHRKVVAKVEVPKPVLEIPRTVTPAPEEDRPEDEDADDGVEGGVAGGVVGGVIGGVVGGTGGGGTMEPKPVERPKPKNVPAFAIAKDMIRQMAPRMSEVFHQSHRGQTVTGMYKVCVDLDGSVYEVTPVKAIDGANDEIVDGIKSGWQYRPQQVPVCFLYNMVVRIEG
ncbi:MAG: PaxA [Myxococcales bacterium]